jgi:hypothetical protein
MYSSTESFDSSFVLKDSGSSKTSPSRLPRMLVEYQLCKPSTPDFSRIERCSFNKRKTTTLSMRFINSGENFCER